jgi:hypothetical protein
MLNIDLVPVFVALNGRRRMYSLPLVSIVNSKNSIFALAVAIIHSMMHSAMTIVHWQCLPIITMNRMGFFSVVITIRLYVSLIESNDALKTSFSFPDKQVPYIVLR